MISTICQINPILSKSPHNPRRRGRSASPSPRPIQMILGHISFQLLPGEHINVTSGRLDTNGGYQAHYYQLVSSPSQCQPLSQIRALGVTD